MPAASLKMFLDQGAEGASASSLSNVLSALKDLPSTTHLISQEKPVCSALLQELIRTSNNSSKSTVARFMALECLFYLSCVPDDNFRQGELFSAVQLLNESFSDTLDREAERLDMHQEMLLVLLLRCTGYSKLKAGDVLSQLCGDEELRLISVLLSILQNSTYERAITHTCFRFFYELTTPVSYFQTSDSQVMETTSVTSFQGKLVNLIHILEEKKAFSTICQHLIDRWNSSVKDFSHGLGSLGSVRGYTSADLSEVQKGEILHWGVILRYLCEMVQNIADFCDKSSLVKDIQQSFIRSQQDFLVAVLIPFTMSTLYAYIHSRANMGETLLATPYAKSAALVMKFLRFALFKPSVELTPELISSLSILSRFFKDYERDLTQNRVNILSLIHFTVALCNVNAAEVKNPKDLSSDFTALLTKIEQDKSPVEDCPYVRGVSHYFIICVFGEDSCCCDSNASTKLVEEVFQKELLEDSNNYEDRLKKLKEELETLQNDLAQLTLVGLFNEVVCVAEAMLATAFFGSLPMQEPASHPSIPPPLKSSPIEKKKHPEDFCCQLTGKLMREPVLLKNGHHFELDALQAVIDDIGHVDPISGETFNDALEVNADLLQRISAYKIDQSVKNAKKANGGKK